MFQSKAFYMKVFGDYALFTDPMSKGGGEKFTYQVPTYQALKGIVEAVYWKPTFIVYIDEVKVLNPIKMESKSILFPSLIYSEDKKRVTHTYLKDVAYAVKFHFEWNLNEASLEKDRNACKHEEIMQRSINRGGRMDIFLGMKECVGFVEPLSFSEYQAIETPFIGEQSFGIMFHSFIYPGGAPLNSSYESEFLYSSFCPIFMKTGTIHFVRPEQCDIIHKLHKYGKKHREKIKNVDEELAIYRRDIE